MSKIILLFTVLLTTIFAQEEPEQFPFIGITVAANTIDLQTITDAPGQNENVLGLRYGKQTLEWRTLFTLAGNSNLQTFDVEIDKILLDQMFGTPKLRPYLGVTLGYLHYDTISSSDTGGFYYGGNFGFLIYAKANIDVDLSYHYYKVSDLDPVDTMQGANLSIHYFF